MGYAISKIIIGCQTGRLTYIFISKHRQIFLGTELLAKILMPSFQLPFDPRKPLKNKDYLIGKLEKYPFFQSFSNYFPTIFPTAFWNENFRSLRWSTETVNLQSTETVN